MSDTQPLSISLNLTDISTAVPLIADGTVARVRLRNISQTERDGNPVIKWELALAEPATTTEGDQVRVGFPIFISFDTSQEFLMQKMARFVDGFLGTGDPNNKKGKPPRPQFNAQIVSQMIGAEAMAKITVIKSKKSDYVGNDISTITYLGDLEPAAA
jgi:hypothetical protein